MNKPEAGRICKLYIQLQIISLESFISSNASRTSKPDIEKNAIVNL